MLHPLFSFFQGPSPISLLRPPTPLYYADLCTHSSHVYQGTYLLSIISLYHWVLFMSQRYSFTLVPLYIPKALTGPILFHKYRALFMPFPFPQLIICQVGVSALQHQICELVGGVFEPLLYVRRSVNLSYSSVHPITIINPSIFVFISRPYLYCQAAWIAIINPFP